MGGRSKKKKAAAAAAASAASAGAAVNGDQPPVDSGPAANGDGIPPPPPPSLEAANGEEQPPANGDGDAPPPPSLEAANGDKLPLDSAAAAKEDGAPPPPPSLEVANGDEQPAANGDRDTPPPPSPEAANGDELPVDSAAAANLDGAPPPPPPPTIEAPSGDEMLLDSAAAANKDGVLPPPPFSAEAPNGDKTPVDSAAEANGDVNPPPVDSAAGGNGDAFEPPPSVEEAHNGGERMAERGLDEEAPKQSRDSSAENLKVLNGMLVKEAVETRGQVAALTAQVDERSADADALAGVERGVLQAALTVPFLAAARYGAALHGRLADIHESLQAAKARAAREADARAEATARLEAAQAENLRIVELLGGKDAEAASASKNVAGMEAVVSDLAGNSTELSAEKGELEKQLGVMSASARSVLSQKEAVEASFRDYRMNTEMYQQEMEVKLDEKSKQLEALRSSKAEMELRFHSLETDLSAAIAKNWELESEVQTSRTELAAAKTEVEMLMAEITDTGEKYNTVVAQAGHLRNEIDKMMTTKDAAAAAFATERRKLEKELDGMKRKVDSIRANKDAAMTSAHQKDTEAAKLRVELTGLRDAIVEQRTHCEQLRDKSFRLQDEVDTVQKALGEEKAEGDKLRLRLGEAESYNSQKELEIVKLKTEVQNKRGQMYTLNGEVNKLQLTVAEAKKKGKSGVWTWLCPTTTVIAAASFAYAARSR